MIRRTFYAPAPSVEDIYIRFLTSVPKKFLENYQVGSWKFRPVLIFSLLFFSIPLCVIVLTCLPSAGRSYTTSRAWRCKAILRGSWSQGYSRTQITLSCWWVEVTAPVVSSSRSPSAPPQTCSSPNLLTTNKTKKREANSPLRCPKCTTAPLSGQSDYVLKWLKLCILCVHYYFI